MGASLMRRLVAIVVTFALVSCCPFPIASLPVSTIEPVFAVEAEEPVQDDLARLGSAEPAPEDEVDLVESVHDGNDSSLPTSEDETDVAESAPVDDDSILTTSEDAGDASEDGVSSDAQNDLATSDAGDESAAEPEETEQADQTMAVASAMAEPMLAVAPQALLAAAPSTATLAESNYNIRYLIQSGYQAVCFGDAVLNQHTMGAVLVQGDLTETTSCTGIADSVLIKAPSYVAGYVNAGNTGFNARKKQNPVQPLYVGRSNTITNNGKTLNGQSGYNVSEGYNHQGTIEYNDSYIDWTLMRSAMDSLSQNLAAGSTQTYSSFTQWETRTIPAGSNVSYANYGTAKTKIAVSGSNSSFTVINILDSGTVYAPLVTTYNGTSLDKSEDGGDMPILFNFPNATSVVIPSDMTPFYGHVVAPNATVEIEGGNYNGIIICKSLKASGEGHVKNYHGPLPSPMVYNVHFDKLNGIGASLEGAELEVLDANGNQVISFTSTGSTFTYPLEVGTYTLHELNAPEGFQLASDVVFTVNNDGSVSYGGRTVSGPVTMTDMPAPVETELVASKTLENMSLSAGDFKFELEAADGAPLPSGSNGTTATATNDADGTVSFGTISYSEPGTYTYTITEKPDSYAGSGSIIYDETSYTATVVVKADAKGKLTQTTTYAKTGGSTVSKPTFTNKWIQGLVIWKVNAKGEALPQDLYNQVKFTIAYKGADGTEDSRTASPNNDGLITLENLRPGTYTITEAQAPEGYMQLQDPITVTISDAGQITLKGGPTNFVSLEEASNVNGIPASVNRASKVLMVKNYPYIVMPETGSNEALAWRCIGMAVTLLGLYALFARGCLRRRSDRKMEEKGGHVR